MAWPNSARPVPMPWEPGRKAAQDKVMYIAREVLAGKPAQDKVMYIAREILAGKRFPTGESTEACVIRGMPA